MGKLQDWWKDDPVANATAENLASNPQKYSEVLSDLLRDKLQSDPGFAEEVQRLVDANCPYVEVVQKLEVADGVSGADIKQLVGGHLSVTQEMKKVRNVTGVKADRLG